MSHRILFSHSLRRSDFDKTRLRFVRLDDKYVAIAALEKPTTCHSALHTNNLLAPSDLSHPAMPPIRHPRRRSLHQQIFATSWIAMAEVSLCIHRIWKRSSHYRASMSSSRSSRRSNRSLRSSKSSKSSIELRTLNSY